MRLLAWASTDRRRRARAFPHEEAPEGATPSAGKPGSSTGEAGQPRLENEGAPRGAGVQVLGDPSVLLASLEL